jgi:hypothetical protein
MFHVVEMPENNMGSPAGFEAPVNAARPRGR